MKKLLKRVYVTWDQPDPNDKESYMLASEDWRGHAAIGKTTRVGVYELVEQIDVTAPETKKPARS